ncbi:hypothetical protein BGX21_009086 [Mortierella sp. AD011]|nr:hypothetical protein BGX20_007817 [Mortierella sp. AD010]KAF9397230.1 hypothetical protein BGX21_009086 [Mortierella sp. AD011]
MIKSTNPTYSGHVLVPSPSEIVFSIPLLVDLISSYLSPHDCYSCSLVSRDFYGAFFPYIFSTIDLRTQMAFHKWARPETQIKLWTQLSAVRSVVSTFGDTYHFLTLPALFSDSEFHRLSVLRCHLLPTVSSNYSENRLWNQFYLPSVLLLIERSPNLKVLDLSFFNLDNNDYSQRLLSEIRKKGRKLQEFQVGESVIVKSGNLPSILCSCAAVQNLKLDIILDGFEHGNITSDEMELEVMARQALFGCVDAHDDGAKGPRLEFAWREFHVPSISYNFELEVVFKMLRHCPRLERLTVPGIVELEPMEGLSSMLLTSSFPRLQHLNLERVDAYTEFINVPTIFTVFLSLKSVVFGSLRNPIDSIDSLLTGSSHSLESVTLVVSTEIKGECIQMILCSCPQLKIFDALGTLGKDLEMRNITEINGFRYWSPVLEVQNLSFSESGDVGWVCHNLEVLRLNFQSHDRTLCIPVSLRQQISKLTKLKELRLHCVAERDEILEPESVHDALLEWRSLSDLRILELRKLGPLVDRNELDRIQQQWTKLEWIQFN